MFDKILIANRGEIACRVIHTAKRMGIKTVAVFSKLDEHAPHVKQADEAFLIGPGPAKESYLNANIIIETALRSGAKAVHPGYGFLSENADFAEALEKAGLVFIGPNAQSIRIMGSKLESKATMGKAGIPVIPGYHGKDQNESSLLKEAQRIGFPLLIKSSAGGGGKGMRLVTDLQTFAEKLAACQRESENYFKDPTVILEKYLAHPRHIEVQVFADSFGNCVHLFERDCSIQRRHQKIIEEAPAYGISNEIRYKLGETAIKIAKEIGYLNAGTVEFLLDEDQQFYFMEMNTRLQVEHPVTEMITGFDLVEWQLKVASGQPLPVMQTDIQHHGHAIEARIYAEDPEHDFLPAAGTIELLRTPTAAHFSTFSGISSQSALRLDSGIEQHSLVTIYYDPLLAKMIAWGQDRMQAIQSLEEGLEQFHIVGLANNASFLRSILRTPEFQQSAQDTGFLERNMEHLPTSSKNLENSNILNTVLMAAFVSEILAIRNSEELTSDPWKRFNDWRMNLPAEAKIDIILQDKIYPMIGIKMPDTEDQNHFNQNHFELRLPDLSRHRIIASLDQETLSLTFQDQVLHFLVLGLGQKTSLTRMLYWEGYSYSYAIGSGTRAKQKTDHAVGQLTAPMTGTLTQMLVEKGSTVKAGEPLMILEAMKMEHAIVAPFPGKIMHLPYQKGDTVDAGAELAIMEPVK